MKLLITGVLTLIILLSGAQPTEIHYEYDADGNRKERYTVFLRVGQSNGTTTTETGFEAAALIQEELGLLDDRQKKLTLTLYPNPVENEVRLEWSEADVKTEEVRVFNEEGKEVFRTGTQNGNFSVPFQSRSSGYYILWIRTQNGIRRYPIIKK